MGELMYCREEPGSNIVEGNVVEYSADEAACQKMVCQVGTMHTADWIIYFSTSNKPFGNTMI